MTTHSNGSHPTPTSPGSAVYVDTENLRDNTHAQQVIAQTVAAWPPDHPPVGALSLYVRADKEELWRLWAEESYPDLRIRVRGVQHFSKTAAKNSADLAITADAIADLATGQTAAVAVISNDSDFGALFVKVRELARSAHLERIPFLWIIAEGGGALSPEIAQFIPERFRWNLSAPLPAPGPAPTVGKATPKSLPAATKPALPAAPVANDGADDGNEAIAQELIRQLPVDRFKASDAEKVIKRRWPQHPAIGNTSQVGQLLKELWPLLQKRGVTMPRKSSPRTYEITQAAKNSIAPPAEPARQDKTANETAEPTPAQLAAAVAGGITSDIFSASDAQAAIKARWPEHPAAAAIPQQFGVWFKNHLWPLMEQHGVAIAKEKPRRYEMTPDARHRLTALG